MRTRWTIAVLAIVVVLIGAAFVISQNQAENGSAGDGSTGTGARVAFYGDSYTLGTGASDPSKRWSTIISKERNWSEFNPSVNGLGFVNNRVDYGSGDLPDMIIKDDPDIVFVTMGLNDNFAYNLARGGIEAQIPDDLDRLAEALPSAHFIVVEPFWYTDERPESLDIISGWVKAAAEDIGADYISGASHWIEGHPEWMAEDGLHPNDAGYAEMAKRMDEELENLGI